MSRMRINGLQTEVNFYKAICCYYFSMPLQNFDKYIVIASRYQLFTYLVALYTCMSSEKYFKSWILRVWLNSIVVVIWFCLVMECVYCKDAGSLSPNKKTNTLFFFLIILWCTAERSVCKWNTIRATLRHKLICVESASQCGKLQRRVVCSGRENILSKPMNKAGITLGSTEGAIQKKVQQVQEITQVVGLWNTIL